MRNLLRLSIAALAVLAAIKFGGCGSETIQQKLPIGDPCAESSRCGTPTHFYCDTRLAMGYCKKDCKSDSDCPTEAICSFRGSTIGQCKVRCDSKVNCRNTQGYICVPASNDLATLASHGYCDIPPGSSLPDAGATVDMSNPGDAAAVIMDLASKGG